MFSLTLEEFDTLAPHLWRAQRPAAVATRRRERLRCTEISVANQRVDRGEARGVPAPERRVSRVPALI
jgi:hypothetical protein